MRDRWSIVRTVIGIGIIVLFALGSVGRVSAEPGEEQIILLELVEGEEYSTYNVDLINEMCALAAEDKKLLLQVEAPGTYYVGADDGGRAVRLRSNVTLDLNGSTLIRSGMMNNFIQGYGLDGERTAGGYELCHDITVKNGTLDGAGGEEVNANLVNIGHARNVTFEDLILKNCRGGHLIELCGCMDVVIRGCTFDGHMGDKTEGEAIQLDISYNGASGSWNGVYTPDGTVCRNVTVTECTFQNYPSGVGNHHALYDGEHSSNIRITDNVFMNQEAACAPAVWCYGFDGCVIENNTITGNYTHGIFVSGGSDVTVRGNVIGAEGKPIPGIGINCTTANGYLVDQGESTQKQPLSGGVITGNRIAVTGSGKFGILVSAGSVLGEITGNEVISSNSDGIRITGAGSHVNHIGKEEDVTGNTIVAYKGMGIAFGDGAGADGIVGNVILSKTGGIQVASGSTVDVIGVEEYPNVIMNDAVGNGVVVTSQSWVRIVSYNRIMALQGDGILAQKEAEIGQVHHNVIFGGCRYGVSVTLDASVKKIYENTIQGYLLDGIVISNTGYVKNISQNRISGGTGAGIYVSTHGVVDCIQKNQIAGCRTKNGHGIAVTATGSVEEIKGNSIIETKGYGISISNTGIRVKRKNNRFLDNEMGKLFVKEVQ